ncbi:MAG TPA: lytic transglycosylase domain-containing protein, partial [Verrucomicrobiota bacterium]|nr:lytic transglycosylase domain-containing protein [Verrucomicrobiota bacterium]
MRLAAILCAASYLCVSANAQTNPPPHAADLVQSVQEFLDDNFDLSALDELEVDADRLNRILAEVQSRFDTTNVFELVSLRQTATNLLPVLLRYEETQPYAAWLETRLDFLEMLDELQRETGPTNQFRGGRLPNPSPEIERKVWNDALAKRPVPARAASMVPVLKPIFISEQVPPELVWLAEVESSFNPSARSPAGALGLFQLMPATAKSLDLSLSPQDERLQPEKNARAAARYLRQLYKRFNDWPLALAAYNAGETRVARLLKSARTHTYDAIATSLPAETQMYVPKVEAVVRKREARSVADLKPPREPEAKSP